DLVRDLINDWGIGTRLYPVRPARMAEMPQLLRLNDSAYEFDIHWLILEPSDWLATMPSTVYLGYPVWEYRPEESEMLRNSLQRLFLELDNGSGFPQRLDTANLGFDLRSHHLLLETRPEKTRIREHLYALQGRLKSVWLPTWSDDLTLVGTISSSS